MSFFEEYQRCKTMYRTLKIAGGGHGDETTVVDGLNVWSWFVLDNIPLRDQIVSHLVSTDPDKYDEAILCILNMMSLAFSKVQGGGRVIIVLRVKHSFLVKQYPVSSIRWYAAFQCVHKSFQGVYVNFKSDDARHSIHVFFVSAKGQDNEIDDRVVVALARQYSYQVMSSDRFSWMKQHGENLERASLMVSPEISKLVVKNRSPKTFEPVIYVDIHGVYGPHLET